MTFQKGLIRKRLSMKSDERVIAAWPMSSRTQSMCLVIYGAGGLRREYLSMPEWVEIPGVVELWNVAMVAHEDFTKRIAAALSKD